MQVSQEIIKTVRSLVDLEAGKDDLYFEVVDAVAAIFPRCLKEQLTQLVQGPIWDGDIISKSHRGILFEMGLVTRVCSKGELGYTGAKYIAYSILKKIKERDNAKQEQAGFSDVNTPSDVAAIAVAPYQINQDVLSALHDERVYQNRKWGTVNTHPHEVGGYLTLMRKLLRDAEDAWQSNRGDALALDELRKVVAVGVACFEQHGVVPRSPASFASLQDGYVPHSV
jgi:hypothetical protein